MDKLVTGPFGSDACYENSFEQDGQQITTWMCMGSGFTTSTLMDKDSEATRNTLETSPELYKDLMHVDENNRAWFHIYFSHLFCSYKSMLFVTN